VGFKEGKSFDEWQFAIFKIVLFLLFLSAVYRLLDSELHIGQLVSKLLGK
jgi:hypothetical protein